MKDNIIEIEFVGKFNPYHDPRTGRFTSPDGGMVTFSSNANTTAGKRAIERETTRQKERAKLKDNPYTSLSTGEIKRLIEQNGWKQANSENEWAYKKLWPKDSIAADKANRKIRAATKRMDKLKAERQQLEDALKYAEVYNKNIPF